jgi:hypothetical protein
MDGNFSLKRVDGSGFADQRSFNSWFHIAPQQVDKFKDEVKSHPAPKHGCVGHWAEASNVSEETVKVFEQTGIFVSACCHGTVETFAEMRHSSELCVCFFYF